MEIVGASFDGQIILKDDSNFKHNFAEVFSLFMNGIAVLSCFGVLC
jgi:hypothetical protein